MAHKLGVSKSEILDPSAENMAVRLALSETQIINETKEFLESHGVCLDAFSSRKERSNSTILVKNIPFDTKDSDIENLFTRYGSVGRVVIPPSRTIALVEFYQENEAKSAFKLLAFSKFKGLPLYLEWAPMGAFKTKSVKEVVTIDSNEQEDDNAPVATLFIKNLNFSTTTADLQESFSVLQGLKSVRVSQKTDKKGIKLSMGYGFAEFDSRQHAITALAAMQGFILHDHALQLKFSNNTVAKKQETESKKDIVVTGTKLIIRNIPFEASKKDIKQLFSAFGTIKALRIPTKLDNSHRGFGFIEFQTRQESKNAFESLSNTHLYGRHLVLEWAQDDESVDGLREKTRKGFVDEEEREVKKRKVVLGGDQEL